MRAIRAMLRRRHDYLGSQEMTYRITTFALLLALSFTPAVTANQSIKWSPECRTPILRVAMTFDEAKGYCK
jgi:hypothetical protein